ncbi:hypothetical protein GCM10010389_28660 [Streptomyces echinoruber]|uniref:Uncharacterized protein n=1 Tax=Streptomyces echinoruber TaxID=68898 RepID=A0A918R968_9ACTN|nr:hypothetical protein GCM10010389_28660 [Streptomyces echinoruber]
MADIEAATTDNGVESNHAEYPSTDGDPAADIRVKLEGRSRRDKKECEMNEEMATPGFHRRLNDHIRLLAHCQGCSSPQQWGCFPGRAWAASP